MSQLVNVKNISKTVSNLFPRVNKTHFIETSIEHTHTDIYVPVNSVDSDRFIEFRIPKNLGYFIDLSSLHLQFRLNLKKRQASEGQWNSYESLATGDHVDISNATIYTLFKQLTIEFNGVQVCNEFNYSLNSYIRLITQFPYDEIKKLGKLFHLELYDPVVRDMPDDTYFSGLPADSPIRKRLVNLRTNGLHLRGPLISDICNISSYLLDGIDIVIRLTLHENSTVLLTSQQLPDVTHNDGKKFYIDLSDISLHVKKIKPSDNAYTALQRTLLPKLNENPTLDYLFTSKSIKQYHLPSGQNEQYFDLPFASSIPEKLFIVFQKYDNFNTKSWKENLLYLEHLNLSNVYITINGTTMYNIKCDFKTGDVAEIYHTTLLCLDKNHLLTLDSFMNGMTILGFPLATYDPSADIRSPYYGVLKIVLSFHERLADPAMAYLLGDVLSILSINQNRDIVLNKN